MKHSTLARMIARDNRSAKDNQPTRQKSDTAHDVDNGTEAASAVTAERTTTTSGDGPHAVDDDA